MKSITQKMLLLDLHEKSNNLTRKSFCNLIKFMIVIGLGLSCMPCLMSQHQCGTVFTEQMKQDIRERVEEGRKNFKKSNQAIVFKVQPFIMRRLDHTSAINPSILSIKEAELNAAFADANIRFEFCQHHYITCNSTYGINTQVELDYLHFYIPDDAIPIFFTSEIFDNTNITGFVPIPISYILISRFGASNDITLVHEMGHYFGLDHTFIEKSDGTFAAPLIAHNGELIYQDRDGTLVEGLEGENCQEVADGFCGTSADYVFFNDPFSCHEVEQYHENYRESEDIFNNYYPPIYNYMSFYPCASKFESDQNDLMALFATDRQANLGFSCSSSVTQDIFPWFCNDEVEETDQLECGGFCHVDVTDHFLTTRCSTLSVEPGDDIISMQDIRVFNLSANTVRDVKVVFNFVETPNDLHTVNIDVIEAGNYRDLDPANISTIGTPSGLYNLEIRLEYAVDIFSDPQIFHICRTNEPIYVTDTGGNSCIEEIIRADHVASNQTVTYDAGRLVELRPGFLADSGQGTTFTASITPCSSALQDDTEEIEQVLIHDQASTSRHQATSSFDPETDDILNTDLFKVSNYPNPFSTKTTIELALNRAEQVRISLSDVNGRFLGDIKVAGLMSEGLHQFAVDGSQYQAGVYYYTVIVGQEHHTGKMILIK